MLRNKNRQYILQDYRRRDYIVTDEILNKAVSYLHEYHHERAPNSLGRKGSCLYLKTLRSFYSRKQKLLTRQLPDVGHSLRRAILRQNWDEAAYLAQFLSISGISRYASVIVRTCFYLLFHHPSSTRELLEDFVRKCTGYVEIEDIRKFIKILFAVREETLPVTAVGKYMRKSVSYKVVDDLYFKDL